VTAGREDQGAEVWNDVQLMSTSGIVASLRRNLAAVVAVCAFGAVLSYGLLHANPGYADTATVAFTLPGRTYQYPDGLLGTSQVMANYMMGTAAQAQIRQAGGTTSYNVASVNLYNMEYPDYGVPYVTVTATSLDPQAAERTFTAVMSVLTDNLARIQQEQGVQPRSQIGAVYIAAPTGPVIQTGSRKRSLIGLAVLTLIAAYFAAAVLDRRSGRLPRRLGFARNTARRHQWADLRPRSSPSVERLE
jgi:hypothetical protein